MKNNFLFLIQNKTQSENAKDLVKSILEQETSNDFPKEAAEKLLKIL